MDCYLQCIKAYFGHICLLQSTDPGQLSLEDYLDPDKFANYVSFLLGRGCGSKTIAHHVSVAKKVVLYLRATMPHQYSMQQAEEAELHQHTLNILGWYENMSSQLAHVLPPAKKVGSTRSARAQPCAAMWCTTCMRHDPCAAPWPPHPACRSCQTLTRCSSGWAG